MKKKQLLLILLCAVMVFAFGFTGCGTDPESPDDSGEVKEEDQTYRVTLFYTNEQYIATGDESLEKFMVYQNEMTSSPGEVYLDALEMLRTSPEEGYGTVISENIKFNDVYLEGDTIFVDLDSNGLHGGSMDETFLISQVVNTLVNTFEEVKQVQFLVDGETAETLMGHIGTADPFTEYLLAE